MSNQELPKISNPVQNLFDKVKQKIGGSPSTPSLSSTDFDVGSTHPSPFKPKRGLKRKPEDEINLEDPLKQPPSEDAVSEQIGKIKDENETVEIKDEVSDENNDERPRMRRNRSVPTIIPPIFLNTPMLLRSELSQKKPNPIEKSRGKEKLRSASTPTPRCTITVYPRPQKTPPAQKLSPSKKPSEIDEVLFVSEEVKSQGDGDKPSLKLLIRQKRKSDAVQGENNVDEKPEKFEKVDGEEDKEMVPINLNNNNVVKEQAEEMVEEPIPLPPAQLQEVASPPLVDVGTLTDESFQVGANEVIDEDIDEDIKEPQESEMLEYVEVIELLHDDTEEQVEVTEPEPLLETKTEPVEEPEEVPADPIPDQEVPMEIPAEEVPTVRPEIMVIGLDEAQTVTPEEAAPEAPEVPTSNKKRGRPFKKTKKSEVEKPPRKITRSSRSAPQIVAETTPVKKTPAKRQTRATPKPTPEKKKKKNTPNPKKQDVKPMVTRRSAMKAKEKPKPKIEKKTRPKPEKKIEEKKLTRSQKKLQNSKEKPKKAEVKVLAKIPPPVPKGNKKKITVTVNKKQKEPAKKPKVTKPAVKKVVKPVVVEKVEKPEKPPVVKPEKRRPKILKPISLKSNTMLIATIVKTTLEQLSAQKKLMKKSKLKQKTLGKKEETNQSQEEERPANDSNETKTDTNTIDNVISQVKEILAKDPSIMNSIVENSTPSTEPTPPDEEEEEREPSPNPALKKLYSVIPDASPRPRGRKPNGPKPEQDSPSTLPNEIISKNEEKLINDIETLKRKCTEDLRQRPVDDSKGDMGVFDFDEFDPEPEEVPHSYKVIKEVNSETDEGAPGDRTPMKQATIFEMFDRVLIKNKRLSVTRSVFEGGSSKEATVIGRAPAESKRKSTEGSSSMPPPVKRQAPGDEEEELFDDDDSRREWMPEELAEYKMKYTAKKEMGGYKPVYKCKICLLVLPTYYKLYKHKEEHVKTKNPYNCKQCDASFGNVNDLVAHIRVHKGKHPYVCQKCDLGFWSKKAYDDHIPIHLLRKVKEPPKKFQCDVCGKRFPKICDIERHVRVHTGEKPFVCNICNKPFQQAHNLSKHLLIHLHLKPFSCEICGKQFGRVDVLNRHVLTHSVKKPVECWLCPKDFIRHSQLSHHVQKEHPEAMDTEIARELFGVQKRRGPMPRKLTEFEDSAETEVATATEPTPTQA